MSCPLILTNATSPSVDFTVADLSEITLIGGASADITDLFDVETIANSDDLQTALTAGDLTLTYAGEPIVDLADLCVTPGELSAANKASYRWAAGRRRNIGANGIDLIALDRSGTSNMPFIAFNNCEIRKAIASSRSTTDWTAVIFKSVDNGANWTAEKTETVDSQTKFLDYALAPISLNQGDMVRVRYERIANTTSYPQVNLLVKDI